MRELLSLPGSTLLLIGIAGILLSLLAVQFGGQMLTLLGFVGIVVCLVVAGVGFWQVTQPQRDATHRPTPDYSPRAMASMHQTYPSPQTAKT